MHLQYFLAVATVLTTVSSFPHVGAGKRQLNGYEAAPLTSSAEAPSESAAIASSSKSKAHRHKTKSCTDAHSLSEAGASLLSPTLSTGFYGTVPSGLFPTGTSYPTGTSPPGTGTGTGGISPLPTDSLAPYANITSDLPLTAPASTGGLVNPISGLPISSFPTGGTGVLPSIISEVPTATKPPFGPYPVPTGSAPPMTITQITTVTQSTTLTVTVTGAGSCGPVSVAPLSSAPFPVLGNGTLGYPTGATGTGNGGLPIGTGTGLPILPPFSALPTSDVATSSSTGSVSSSVIPQTPVQEATSSLVSDSAIATAATASLVPYT